VYFVHTFLLLLVFYLLKMSLLIGCHWSTPDLADEVLCCRLPAEMWREKKKTHNGIAAKLTGLGHFDNDLLRQLPPLYK
jgi:hypothetical protein